MRKRSRTKTGAAVNEYAGYTVKEGDVIETVNAKAVTPQAFFQRFVTARKPCIVEGLSEELPADLSLAALVEQAGDCVVDVEEKPFGSGNKVQMPFKDFCADMSERYMTTQGEQDEVVSNTLRGTAVPHRVSLSGHLQLANLNMWLGGARATKTPLHVDFHDNFYLLLEGRKTFALFSPDGAGEMKTMGRVVRVHRNGLVNFEGGLTNADGSTEYALAERALHGDDEEAAEEALEKMLRWQEEDERQTSRSTMGGDPSHFCRVTAEEAAAKKAQLVVQLAKGQALYLPAGWFHQVESHLEGAHHWAMNWWFHPPDKTEFDRPYSNWI